MTYSPQGFSTSSHDDAKPEVSARMPYSQLLMNFESLGDNCEFGLVQRYCGIEPLGLFRFNNAKLPSLLQVLKTRLSDLDSRQNIEVFLSPGREFMVRINPHNFVYHTGWRSDNIQETVVFEREIKRIKFLKRKFLEDLHGNEKIFVRKSWKLETLEDIQELHSELKKYGKSKILWVVKASDKFHPGTVENLGEGLFRGYIDWFSPLTDVHHISLPVWIQICQNAYILANQTISKSAKTLGPPPLEVSPNLLTAEEAFDKGKWRNTKNAEIEVLPLSFRTHSVVLRHALNADTVGYAGQVFFGEAAPLPQRKIYVVSAWVWVPKNFNGKQIAVSFSGIPALVIRRADVGLRSQWQRVWSSGFGHKEKLLRPCLNVVGMANDIIYSTCWKVEEGNIPT